MPVAAAVLAAFGMLDPELLNGVMMAGEISLNGEVHGVSGILPMVIKARDLGCRMCVVPYENIKEGRLIRDMPVAGVRNLKEMKDCLINPKPYLAADNDYTEVKEEEDNIDFSLNATAEEFGGNKNRYCRCLLSTTELWFYLPLALVCTGIIIVTHI